MGTYCVDVHIKLVFEQEVLFTCSQPNPDTTP